jgi:hypothetical protein
MVDKTIYTGGVINDKLGGLSTTFVTQVNCFPTSVATAFGTWVDSTGIYTAPNITFGDPFGDPGQPDGIMFKIRVEAESVDPSLHAFVAKVVQVSGTGEMITSEATTVMESSDDQISHVSCWAICHNPSASATFSVQMRDAGVGGGTTDDFLSTTLEIFPIDYAAIGMYSSTSASIYSGTTANQITGWGTDYESDTAKIQRNGNGIDLKTNNSRYLVLASCRWLGFSGNKTGRVVKIFADGTPQSMDHFYWGSTLEDFQSGTIVDLVESGGTTVDLNLRMYQGDGISARQGGAEDAGSAPTSALHSLCVIELKAGCEVFRSHDPTGQQVVATPGPIDIDVCDTVDFNDAASWTKKDVNEMDATVTMDALLGAQIACPYNGTSGFRWSAEGAITVNTVEEPRSVGSAFARGDDGGTAAVFGSVAKALGIISLTAGDDVGVSVNEGPDVSQGGGGKPETEPFASNEGIVFWGINLDTMDNEGAIIPQIMHYRTVQASN